MANILDSNTPYIDTPPIRESLPESSPMEAAKGNLGGLQMALENKVEQPQQAPQSPAGGLAGVTTASRQPFGIAAQDEFRKAIMDRIRSPEAIQSALEGRQGALQKLKEANAAPMNDWTSSKYFMQGLANSDTPWDASRSFGAGFANQMKGEAEQASLKRSSGIANAQADLDFQKNEEGISDKREQNVMGDAAKMFSATRFKNGGMLNVPTRGLVDLNQIEADGSPKIVLDSAKVSVMVHDSIAMAQKQANQKEGTGELNFGTGPDAADKRNAWIMQTAQGYVAPSIAALNMHPGSVAAMFAGVPITQQSGGVEASKKAYVGNKEVDPRWLANQMKMNPGATVQQPDFSQPIDSTHVSTTAADYNKNFPTQPRIQPETMPIGAVTNITEKNRAIGSAGSEEYNEVQKQAFNANQVLNTTRDIASLPNTETGMLAGIKMKAGDIASAFGVAPSLIANATDLHELNTQLETHVTGMLQQMKGAHSEQDVDRYRDYLARTSNPAEVFKFNLEHAREAALRMLEMGKSYRDSVTSDANSTDPRISRFAGMNASSDWQAKNNALGPNFITVNNDAGEKKQLFRSQAFEKLKQAYPKADSMELKQSFDNNWLNNPEKFNAKVK